MNHPDRAATKIAEQAKTLREEADWLIAAYENSRGEVQSEEFRQGFKSAAQWVRCHADGAKRVSMNLSKSAKRAT